MYLRNLVKKGNVKVGFIGSEKDFAGNGVTGDTV
jgi:hypothetical protein